MTLKPRFAFVARAICSSTVLAALLMVGSCGDDNNNGPTTTVGVTLKEFSVTPDQASAPHGRVKFEVSNVGEDMHEFLVIKTDLAPDKLPTEANGSYEEDGPGTDLLDEIELVNPGETKNLTLNLKAGHYVLICNMVHEEEDGEVEVHYQLGMRTSFTVS
jgi:uncharacterized cupredoxin-like copper-binding protein